MSVLKLTPFNINDDVLNDYTEYEKSQRPEIGEDVFIYHHLSDDKNKNHKPGNYVNQIDKVNFSIVRKAFGYAAKDKFDKMAVQQVKNNSNKINGAKFINSRAEELSKMYDELVELFLIYLHKSVWNTYESKAAKKKYVLSTINFQDAYDDLKMGIDSFELILTKIIDDKYNEKYAETETINANKQKTLDIEQRVGTIKNKMKK